MNYHELSMMSIFFLNICIYIYIHISGILSEHLENVLIALQPWWSFVGEQRPLFAVMAEGDEVPVFR